MKAKYTIGAVLAMCVVLLVCGIRTMSSVRNGSSNRYHPTDTSFWNVFRVNPEDAKQFLAQLGGLYRNEAVLQKPVIVDTGRHPGTLVNIRYTGTKCSQKTPDVLLFTDKAGKKHVMPILRMVYSFTDGSNIMLAEVSGHVDRLDFFGKWASTMKRLYAKEDITCKMIGNTQVLVHRTSKRVNNYGADCLVELDGVYIIVQVFPAEARSADQCGAISMMKRTLSMLSMLPK